MLPTDTLATGYVFGERQQSVAVVTTISGTVFLEEGLARESASALTESLVEVRKAAR